MDSPEVIRRLHEHRMWANRQLLDAAEPLSPEQLRQTFAIGQGSIWKTLCHLYAAEYVWLAALEGDADPLTPGDVRGQLPGNQAGEGAVTSLAELRRRWEELEGRWRSFLDRVTPESLERMVYKRSTRSGPGQSPGTREVDVLLHVCTHAQYTTAQLVNMLRQLGCERLPDVMLISLARREAAEAAG